MVTFATILVMHQLGGDWYIEPLARQLDITVRLAANVSPLDNTATFHSGPDDGSVQDKLTNLLGNAFVRRGDRQHVVVTRPAGEQSLAASIELAPARWLIIPIAAARPPPGAWLVFGGWMALIFLGTGAISLIAAQRITRPLALLEAAAIEFGTKGDLPQGA